MNKKMSANHMFREAENNFKNVFYAKKSRNKKLAFLPKWLLKESKYLISEKKHRTDYKTFKRGAIVYVDFGVNVGDELSGPHFAIILNKNDSPKNGTLTVLPLTSHFHPSEIELNDTIRNLSSDKFVDQGIGAMMVLYAAQVSADLFYLKQDPKLPNAKARLHRDLVECQKGKPYEHLAIKLFNLITHTIPDTETAARILSRNGKTTNIDLGYYLSPSGDPSHIMFADLKILISTKQKYERYNRKTYAKIADVTTISKQRLQSISPFDPVGEILVSNQTLTKIDQAFAQMFIKKTSIIDNSNKNNDN